MPTSETPRGSPALRGPSGLETVIWDFNGTLIDDVDHIVRSVNVLLARRRLPQLTVDSFRHIFGFPVAEYYRKIGFDLEAESMADLSGEFFELYMPGLPDCSLCDGAPGVLSFFKKIGIRQFVLSAMKEGLLRAVIAGLGIADCFTAIYGLEHLEGDSKVSRGRDLMSDFRIRPQTSLLIGDTDHDAEVAEELGLSIVLIANGHQSESRLRATGNVVIESPKDLIGLMEEEDN